MTSENKRKTIFCQIVIQSKDDKEDFRSFCQCIDREGNLWELRGYGETAADAATDAWNCYLDDDDWELHGCVVKSFE